MIHQHTILRVDKEDLGDGTPEKKDHNAYFNLRANRRLTKDIPEVMKSLNALREQYENENREREKSE